MTASTPGEPGRRTASLAPTGTTEPKDSERDLNLLELLAAQADSDKHRLAKKILALAAEGDRSSLNALVDAINTYGTKEAERLPITDEQYKQVLRLAFERDFGPLPS